MTKKLDLEILYTFTIVAETGELKKTAEILFKSHSAVCMQIKRLEDNVGVPLIERKHNRIALTEKGEILLSYCKRILFLNDAAIAALQDNDISGQISFGVPTDYAKDFVTILLPSLKNKLPNLQAKIVCERSRSLRNKIISGNLDIAIVAGETGVIDEEFLWSEKLLWVSSPSFQYDNSHEIPVAIFEDDCIVRNLTLDGLKSSRLRYKQVFASAMLDNIADAVFNGMAISLLPESMLTKTNSKVLPNNIIKSKDLLIMNLIRSSTIDDNVFRIVCEHIKDTFTSNNISRNIKANNYVGGVL
ncbi:MAG: LysR family transcriptional regulator [Dehalobacterium sp.]